MFSRLIAVSTAAALALVAPAALRAQTPTPSRASLGGLGSAAGRFTLAGAFGGLSGAANLNPAGTTDWRLGWIGSLDGTVWLQSHVGIRAGGRSEEHTSELQSQSNLVCRLLLEKKNTDVLTDSAVNVSH